MAYRTSIPVRRGKKSCSSATNVSLLRDHRQARSPRPSCVRTSPGTGREERNFMAPRGLPIGIARKTNPFPARRIVRPLQSRLKLFEALRRYRKRAGSCSRFVLRRCIVSLKSLESGCTNSEPRRFELTSEYARCWHSFGFYVHPRSSIRFEGTLIPCYFVRKSCSAPSSTSGKCYLG